MSRKATLNDVVAASGLSIFTVSRALNRAEGVSEGSRKRVLEAAKAVGYVPNLAAKAVRNQTPGPVIVMTASTSNAYYIDMLSGIQAGLRSAGLGMRTADLAPEGIFDAELEEAAVQEAMQSRASGVISTLTLGRENYEKLTAWGCRWCSSTHSHRFLPTRRPQLPPIMQRQPALSVTISRCTDKRIGFCLSTPRCGALAQPARTGCASQRNDTAPRLRSWSVETIPHPLSLLRLPICQRGTVPAPLL